MVVELKQTDGDGGVDAGRVKRGEDEEGAGQQAGLAERRRRRGRRRGGKEGVADGAGHGHGRGEGAIETGTHLFMSSILAIILLLAMARVWHAAVEGAKQ